MLAWSDTRKARTLGTRWLRSKRLSPASALPCSPTRNRARRIRGRATALEKLGSEISEEASGFQGLVRRAELHDQYHISQARLARMLLRNCFNAPSSNQAWSRLGKQRKGNPVMDPGTLPELAPVAVGIVTTDKGVLIAHRRDERPPWTFPGGEIQPGESPADALRRRIPQETGVEIKVLTVLGRRVHPRTNRLMVYLACQAADDATEPQIGEAAVDDHLDASVEYGMRPRRGNATGCRTCSTWSASTWRRSSGRSGNSDERVPVPRAAAEPLHHVRAAAAALAAQH